MSGCRLRSVQPAFERNRAEGRGSLDRERRSRITSSKRQSDWSGQRDSNPRPPAPKAGALPGCAMPRRSRPCKWYSPDIDGSNGFDGQCIETAPKKHRKDIRRAFERAFEKGIFVLSSLPVIIAGHHCRSRLISKKRPSQSTSPQSTPWRARRHVVFCAPSSIEKPADSIRSRKRSASAKSLRARAAAL